MSSTSDEARRWPTRPGSGVAPAPASPEFAQTLATAVEVAEHETRMAAEQLERCTQRLVSGGDLLLGKLSAEREDDYAGDHRQVTESDGLGSRAVDQERALATYIAKRDGLVTLRRLLAEAT